MVAERSSEPNAWGNAKAQGEGSQGKVDKTRRVRWMSREPNTGGATSPFEPCATKVACTVREEAVAKGLSSRNHQKDYWQVWRNTSTSVAAYFILVQDQREKCYRVQSRAMRYTSL